LRPTSCRWLLVAAALVAMQADARRSGAPRTRPVEWVVIHSTGGPSCDQRTGHPIWVGAGTLAENIRHIEAHPRLGIHYMIDRDGAVRVSVPEDQVAHHVYRISDRSIAIELVNEGDGRDPFPEPQLAALVALLREVRERHGVAREGLMRHSDLDHGRMPCDPTRRRKVDPGDAFPYEAVRDRVFGPR
jgi:N-acetyl-anhydromuramyl-L-alanine amidase AmpD